MRDVNKKFSVRYFLNLVLVDEEDRRYFKQQVWSIAVLLQNYLGYFTCCFEPRAGEKPSVLLVWHKHFCWQVCWQLFRWCCLAKKESRGMLDAIPASTIELALGIPRQNIGWVKWATGALLFFLKLPQRALPSRINRGSKLQSFNKD